MEGRNVMYSVVGVFVLGLLLGTFFSGGFTGRAVNTLVIPTEVTIIPSRASPGDIIYITVDSTRGAASPLLYIRDFEGSRRDRIEWCRGLDDFGNDVIRTGSDEDSECRSKVTVSYKVPQSFRGSHYVEVYEHSAGEYVRAYFEVTG